MGVSYSCAKRSCAKRDTGNAFRPPTLRSGNYVDLWNGTTVKLTVEGCAVRAEGRSLGREPRKGTLVGANKLLIYFSTRSLHGSVDEGGTITRDNRAVWRFQGSEDNAG